LENEWVMHSTSRPAGETTLRDASLGWLIRESNSIASYPTPYSSSFARMYTWAFISPSVPEVLSRVERYSTWLQVSSISIPERNFFSSFDNIFKPLIFISGSGGPDTPSCCG